jgi:putative glutathione S-transferase
MGYLQEGQWHGGWYDTRGTGGRFVRQASRFRNRVTADGSSGFPAEAGRYHLYVSLACPWAHRTLIVRHLKGLEEVVSVSVVEPVMGGDGWAFGSAGATADTANGAAFLRDVYRLADPRYSGRVTVPVLWDKARRTIVNNESSEIILMFNGAFGAVIEDDAARALDLYPEPLRPEIDRINDFVYDRINNGVYKCGFATTQEAYEEAFDALFDALDRIEQDLAGRRYLAGDALTLADWRLFTTLVRFDAVYVGHFKCNLRRLVDYPNLWGYTRELYQMPGIAQTVDFTHIKKHYYQSHESINPTRIVPKGPALDFAAPHGRR